MSESVPTQQEAQAALEQATNQAARVRRADHQLGWILLAVSAVFLAAALVISTLPDLRRGSPLASLAILAIVAFGVVGVIVVGLRIRAYSRTAIFLYFGGIIGFNLWNVAVSGVSILTGWWASTQPSYHFGISELVGSIPLLVAAWLIWRR